MKTIFVLIPFLSVALAQNGGFFSGITGAFNDFFNGGSSSSNTRPLQQQPARPRPQQFQQQQFQQQQQFNQPPRQQSRPAPPPSAPVFRPQSQRIVSSAPATQTNTVVGGTSLCGAAAPNHFWTDPRDNIKRGYVATWKIGCTTFQQHEAKAYCESMGMEPVSLDSPAKQDNFNR